MAGTSERARVREVVRGVGQQIGERSDMAVILGVVEKDYGTGLKGHRYRGARWLRTHALCGRRGEGSVRRSGGGCVGLIGEAGAA